MIPPHKHTPEIRPHMKPYQFVNAFLSMGGDKLEWARLANKMKNFPDYASISEALSDVFHTQPLIRRVVWGNTAPRTIAELGNGDNSYFFLPKSLDEEIRWVIAGLRPLRQQLRQFIMLRDEVEGHILLGNKHEAQQLLDASLKEFGYSIWYYEMRLTLAGSTGDYATMLTLIDEVNQANQGKRIGIVPQLMYYLYKRSTHNLSPYEYDNALYSRYKSTRTLFQNDRYSYFLFRLNYYQYYNLDCLSAALIMESVNSSIDRYILLLHVLRSYYIQQPEQRQSVQDFVRQLYNLTSDPQLLPFRAINDMAEMPDNYFDAAYVTILDDYYTGRYEDVTDKCHAYLNEHPTCFDIIKIYCRALTFLNRGYRHLADDSSLLDTIAFEVYSSMTSNDGEPHIDRLYQLCKNCYGLRIAASLDHYVKAEQNIEHSLTLEHLSMIQFDPFFVDALPDDDRRKEYLEAGLRRMPHSPAILYRKHCVERNITDADRHIMAYIRNVDRAKITFEGGSFEETLAQWRQILQENEHSLPTAQTAVEYIFRSLIALGVKRRKEAVDFYIEQYLINHARVSKVDTTPFLGDLTRSRYQGLRSDNINLLLFVCLNSQNYPQKQFVLQEYCRGYRATIPSQLIGKLRHASSEQATLLFDILLTDDILYHHYKLKSTIEVLDEKLRIVTYLKQQHPEERYYSDFSTELMHELIAYRGMTKLDDSKIYVNEDAVMKYELSELPPIYERFKKQAEITRNRVKVIWLRDIDVADAQTTTESIRSAVSYTNNANAEAATQLFGIIRHAFLKSRFGLGTYLSTRIRHGVFEGELRSDLERLNLVLSTDHDVYQHNDYWLHEFSLDSNSDAALHRSLQQFSQGVDTLISGFKENVIQIREEAEENGVIVHGDFNYVLSEDEICQKLQAISEQTDNVNDFSRSVIAWLWQITEQNLETVRGKIQAELRPRFTQLLDKLESDSDQFATHRHFHHALTTAINDARRQLNTQITKVERWFHRQEAKFEDFRLSDYVQMALDTINKYMPDVRYDCVPDIQDPVLLFRSEYSASMFDLLTIFFSNMFQHCRRERVCPFVIKAEHLEGFIMHLHLENNLPLDAHEEELNLTFAEKLQDESLLQTEGGSGLIKAMTHIRFDFQNPANTFTIRAAGGKCIIDIQFHIDNMLRFDEKTAVS